MGGSSIFGAFSVLRNLRLWSATLFGLAPFTSQRRENSTVARGELEKRLAVRETRLVKVDRHAI
jgi:hypothetical protein